MRIAIEGHFQFVIHTIEDHREPPHVHVRIGKDAECRLVLYSQQFMENPPDGERHKLLAAYRKHAEIIIKEWDRIHGR